MALLLKSVSYPYCWEVVLCGIHVSSNNESQLLICTSGISFPLDSSIKRVGVAVLKQAEQIGVRDSRANAGDGVLYGLRTESPTSLTRALVGEIVASC